DPTDPTTGVAEDTDPSTAVVSMQLVGANPNAVASGVNELATKTNYFVGNDPSQWRTNVANYASAQFSNVYNGIDVAYYGNARNDLEHDFIVAPGADPSQIV